MSRHYVVVTSNDALTTATRAVPVLNYGALDVEAPSGELLKPRGDLFRRHDVAKELRDLLLEWHELRRWRRLREGGQRVLHLLGTELAGHELLDIPPHGQVLRGRQRKHDFLRPRLVLEPKVERDALVGEVLDVVPPVLRQVEHVAGFEDCLKRTRLGEEREALEVGRIQVHLRLAITRMMQGERVKAAEVSR